MINDDLVSASQNYFQPMEEIACQVMTEFGELVEAEPFAWRYPEGEEPFWIGYHFRPRNPYGAEVRVFFDVGIRVLCPPRLDVAEWGYEDSDGPARFIKRIGLYGVHYTRSQFPWGRLSALVPEDQKHYEKISQRRTIPLRHHCPW